MNQALEYFKQISNIPRSSWKEWKIRDFLILWAGDKWFEYKVDKTGNLIIYVPWDTSKPSVILQAHMDMVCVKTVDLEHNFETDPLELYEEDGYLKAKNTSLGADNGIWIALAMSATDFENHPSLELVFTVDEEVWMSWVLNLDFSLLKSKNVINIDHWNDSEVIISSAWWAWIILGKDLELFNSDDKKYDLEIFWMKWGHSWIEIHKNHWSAIEIFLKFLSSNTLINNIYSINSWTAHNVIPSQIEVILSTFQIDELKTELTKYIEEVKKIYDCPNISFKIEENNSNLQAISNWKQILSDISKIKVWVYKMSEKIPDLTETSMSLGILKTENSKINLNYLARSCINKDLKNLVDSTSEFYSSLNYKIKIDEWYPGWQDDTDSELVKITKEEITKVIWKTPKIIAIHAWLECGALVSWLGEWTHAITIGPNLYDIHSINEKVEISSVEKLEKILNWILARL